jgi:hypothetical protein
MKILILVEGQTEFRFVREVLYPHLAQKDIYIIPTIAESAPGFKGGGMSYARIRKTLKKLLGDTSAGSVTTMFDYYHLPDSFPGYHTQPAGGHCYQRADHLEQALADDLVDRRFIPYLALHEFEAMLFADPVQIANHFAGIKNYEALVAIRSKFNSPEEIDDGETTSPARRIQALFPGYKKLRDGLFICQAIGLDRIRVECPHFNQWLRKLETLSERTAP